MAIYYVKRINQKKLTIDQVPALWRAAVEALLEEGE